MVNHPKKFYVFTMIFLIISYIGNITYSLYNERPTRLLTSKFPVVKIEENKTAINQQKIHERMKKIVSELQSLKVKRDNNSLIKQDSLRIEYLFNQYQRLKNELQEN